MIKCASCFIALAGCVAAANTESPGFTSVQPGLFVATEALSNAFADFDGDGDLDREGRRHKRVEGVDPRKWTGKTLVVKADD